MVLITVLIRLTIQPIYSVIVLPFPKIEYKVIPIRNIYCYLKKTTTPIIIYYFLYYIIIYVFFPPILLDTPSGFPCTNNKLKLGNQNRFTTGSKSNNSRIKLQRVFLEGRYFFYRFKHSYRQPNETEKMECCKICALGCYLLVSIGGFNFRPRPRPFLG